MKIRTYKLSIDEYHFQLVTTKKRRNRFYPISPQLILQSKITR